MIAAPAKESAIEYLSQVGVAESIETRSNALRQVPQKYLVLCVTVDLPLMSYWSSEDGEQSPFVVHNVRVIWPQCRNAVKSRVEHSFGVGVSLRCTHDPCVPYERHENLGLLAPAFRRSRAAKRRISDVILLSCLLNQQSRPLILFQCHSAQPERFERVFQQQTEGQSSQDIESNRIPRLYGQCSSCVEDNEIWQLLQNYR